MFASCLTASSSIQQTLNHRLKILQRLRRLHLATSSPSPFMLLLFSSSSIFFVIRILEPLLLLLFPSSGGAPCLGFIICLHTFVPIHVNIQVHRPIRVTLIHTT